MEEIIEHLKAAYKLTDTLPFSKHGVELSASIAAALGHAVILHNEEQ